MHFIFRDYAKQFFIVVTLYFSLSHLYQEIVSHVISVLQKSYFLINALSSVRSDCVGEFLASQEVQTQQNEWVERATPTLRAGKKVKGIGG